MIGPADIEDMMLDHTASGASVAKRQVPNPQPNYLLGWAWWLSPAALLAFEAQKLIQLWLLRLALGGQEG